MGDRPPEDRFSVKLLVCGYFSGGDVGDVGDVLDLGEAELDGD